MTYTHRAPHQVVRYAPVLRRLRRSPPGIRVLEVGSGVEGLGTWHRRRFVGVDRSFLRRPVPSMRAVMADGTHLPFGDGSFDVVACIDVLQDVPRELLPAFCTELARVANGVVVATTAAGPDAEASDRRMLAWVGRQSSEASDWLAGHVERGLPEVEMIRELFARTGACAAHPNMSVAWHERLFRIERKLRMTRAMGAVQPLIRAWGRIAPLELKGSGPTYRWTFVLETGATSSPPSRDS